ncbi:MAG: thiamine phosphate synthase, partial [Epulopiscium sp.]|nr:thiamine phosphate synthase [Candidatus Epulonipiscium sp.]
AEKNGADYLGVGAMFPTSTKEDAADVSFDTLKAICNAVSIPVVAIGGINAKNVMQLKGSGVDGIAVVSAIFAANNIMLATQELADITKRMIEK